MKMETAKPYKTLDINGFHPRINPQRISHFGFETVRVAYPEKPHRCAYCPSLKNPLPPPGVTVNE